MYVTNQGNFNPIITLFLDDLVYKISFMLISNIERKYS